MKEKEKNEKRIFKVITYMSLILITVFTFFMLLPSKDLQAQAEFTGDYTFVISNADYNINEEDVKELFLFFIDYVRTYDLLGDLDETTGNMIYQFENENENVNGLNIDFNSNLPDLDFTMALVYNDLINIWSLGFNDYKYEPVFNVVWYLDTDEFNIVDIVFSYDFSIIITLPEPPPVPLYNQLNSLINFFVQPFLDLITDIGVGDNIISIGFGSIEWFNFTLLQLANLILSFLVIWIFLKLIFRLLKLVIRIITGGAINV